MLLQRPLSHFWVMTRPLQMALANFVSDANTLTSFSKPYHFKEPFGSPEFGLVSFKRKGHSSTRENLNMTGSAWSYNLNLIFT